MTKATYFNPATATAVKPLREMNIVGPYSAWPRERGGNKPAPFIIYAATATVTGAAAIHCFAPALT